MDYKLIGMIFVVIFHYISDFIFDMVSRSFLELKDKQVTIGKGGRIVNANCFQPVIVGHLLSDIYV